MAPAPTKRELLFSLIVNKIANIVLDSESQQCDQCRGPLYELYREGRTGLNEGTFTCIKCIAYSRFYLNDWKLYG